MAPAATQSGVLRQERLRKRTPTKASGRLHRRSAEEIAAVLDRVVALVKTSKQGMRAEDIRVGLGVE